jgi:four helix bundle protein
MQALQADLKFRDQMRDAAEAAPRLIAEGFARWSHREFARYLVMARGELMELRSNLRALERRRALAEDTLAELLELTDHTTRTIDRLRSSLANAHKRRPHRT